MAYLSPTYVAKGTFQSGTTAITPGLPSGIRNGDMLILIVESANEAITTPTGWTQFTNSPQSTGTAAAAGGVRLGAFYKFVNGPQTAPSVADTGNHTTGIIFAVRNVDKQNPISATAGRVTTPASTSMSWSDITTAVENEMILLLTAVDRDAASTTNVGTVTNANLTGITEIHDESVTSGVGGGVHAAYGFKATAGAIGTSTATGAASVTYAYLTVGLRGKEAVVRTVGQYGNDESTVIAVGGTTTDGITNNVGLVGEYSPAYLQDSTLTPKLERELIATSFDNTANITLRNRKPRASDATSSRRGGGMVYDDVNKRYIFFGGYDGTTRYNDVWEYYTDVPGSSWRKVTTTGTAPTGRNLFGMTIVRGNLTSGGALRMYAVIWGGADPNDKNDMFLLRIDTPGSEAWTTVTQTSAPSIRSYMANHIVGTPGPSSDQAYVYLFGGWAASRENLLVRCTIDVDSPSTCTWTTLTANGAGGSPSARSGALLDYKASTSKLYLYGGYNGTTMLNDFWSFDISGGTWTQETVSGTAPTASEVPAGGYDATNNRFWFTGGWTTNGTFSTSLNQIGYISDVGGSEAYNIVRANDYNDHSYAPNSFAANCIDTDRGLLVLRGMATYDSTERYHYAIDLNDGITSGKPVYGVAEGEALTARDAPASVWNPDASEWVMIGGYADSNSDTLESSGQLSGTHTSGIWVYNQSANTWRYANKGFKTMPPMEGIVGCYDTSRNRILIFGGLTGVDYVSNEVWALTRDDNGNYAAERLDPTGTPPSARWLGICAYDETNDRMITGMGRNVSTLYNDMYSLSFSGGADGAWTTLSPTGTPPTAASQPAFFNKTSNTRLYVFGGATNTGATAVSSQLLYFDYSTTNGAWTTPTSSGATARRGMGFGYDSTNDRLVIWGGHDASAVVQSAQYFLLSGTTWSTAANPTPQPTGRRSLGSMFISGKLYIFGGRPTAAGSMWHDDTWELTPNYGTPASSTWSDKAPRYYVPIYFKYTGGTTSTSHHWQIWATENSTDGQRVSFGGNAESVADFIISSGTPQYTKTHTTDSLIRKASSRTHTTDSIRRKQFTLVHTTSSMIRKQFTKTHTTDALKRQQLTRTHTTDANKKKALTVTHTTSANKKVTGTTRTHTTDAIKRKQFTATHTTDSLKRKSATISHTTDSFKRKQTSLTHTTDSLKRKQLTVTHSTDALKRAPTTRSHTTSSAIRHNLADFYDNFNDNSFNTSLWTVEEADLPGNIVNETNYRLEFTMTPADQGWATVKSVNTYNLNDGAISIRYQPHFSGWSMYQFGIVSDDLNDSFYVEISPQDFTTKLGYSNGGSGGVNTLASWGYPSHRYMRLRVSGGTAYIDSSSDGVTWNVEGSQAWTSTDGKVYIYEEIDDTGTSPVTSWFDNFNFIPPKERYWVGGTGDWGDRAHWSYTSGGTGGAEIPTYEDDVFFDANSFTANGQTVSNTTAVTMETKDMDWTGVTENVTFEQSGESLNISGSLILCPTLTWSNADYHSIYFDGWSGGTFYINTYGIDLHADVRFQHTTGSTYELQSDFVTTYDTNYAQMDLSGNGGTFITNGYDITTFLFQAWRQNFTLGDSIINVSDDILLYSPLTIASNTATFKHLPQTGSGQTFSMDSGISNVYHYHNTNTTGTTYFDVHTNTFNTVTLNAGTTLRVDRTVDLTATNWNFNGTSGNPVTIYDQFGTSGTDFFNFNKTSGTVTGNYLDIQDSIVGGGALWYAGTGFVDSGNNIGWIRTYTKTHTTDANKKKANNTSIHTTDSLKRVTGARTHTTDSLLRKQFTKTHTTDANKKKSGITVSHSTDSLKRKQSTLSHTTSSNKKVAGNTRTHTTDALKRKEFSLSHSTNSLLRKQFTKTHTTDANKKKADNTLTHTSDSLKRTQNTVSHTTDAYLTPALVTYTKTHTTDALKRKQFTLTHFADANKKKATTVSHTTSSNKKKANNTLVHTTDSNKKKSGSVSHTTDTLIRKQFTKSHTTDAFKRIRVALTHSTSSFLRKANTVAHTTDSLLREQNAVSHTTSANKKKQFAVSHTADANKRKSGNTVTHTTNALKRSQTALNHSTDALLRERNELTHTTNSFLRERVELTHSTNSFLRKENTRSHTTDANKKRANNTVTHTADANKKRSGSVSHTTDALKRTQNTRTHTTNALLREQNTLSHSTDSFKRTQNTRTHTTDSYLRGANQASHTTDANKKLAGNTVSHTTSANKKKAGNTVSHSTDSFKRTQNTRTHTTNSLLRSLVTKTHTTSAFLRRSVELTHTTDTNKRRANTLTHTADANKKKSNNTVAHTADANRRKLTTVQHTTNTLLRRQLTLSHTTDTLKRTTTALAHTTSALLRKANSASHTTNALKRTANVVSHATDALKRSAVAISHTTSSFLRKQVTPTHTTDANKKKAGTVSHVTDAFVRGANQAVHNTDANKRKETTVSHTTDASKKIVPTRSHTTNALLRKTNSIVHTTNALLRKAYTATHSTSSNLKKATTRNHTTDSALRAGDSLFHTTSANKKLQNNVVSHTTSANKRGLSAVSHTTNAFIRKAVSVAHTTNALIRKAYSVIHTTSSNKKKAGSSSHSTSSVLRASDLLSHSTDSSIRVSFTRVHTTDAFLRGYREKSHTTDTNKKRFDTVAHTTDATLASILGVGHTTDASLWTYKGTKRVKINGQWVYGKVYVLNGLTWVLVPVYYYNGVDWVLTEQ